MEMRPEEDRFQNNTIILGNVIMDTMMKLHNKGYKEIDLNIVNTANQMVKLIDKKYLIDSFIEKTHKTCWDRVKQRDELFFVDNINNIYSYLPMEKVEFFKKIFSSNDEKGNPIVPMDFRNKVWEIMEGMIKISIKYVHRERKLNPGFLSQVDLDYHKNKWNVALI